MLMVAIGSRHDRNDWRQMLRSISLFLVILFGLQNSYGGPNCALTFSQESIISFLQKESNRELISQEKLEELAHLKWYQLSRKKLFEKLSNPVSSFKSAREVEKVIVSLTQFFYPASYLDKLGDSDGLKLLEQKSKSLLIEKGIKEFIRNSEIPLKEKNKWVNAVLTSVGAITNTLIQPWTILDYFEGPLKKEEAQSFIYDGAEKTLIRYPHLRVDASDQIIRNRLKALVFATTIVFAGIGYYYDHNLKVAQKTAIAYAQAYKINTQLNAVRSSLIIRDANSYFKSIREAAYEETVQRFSEKIGRKPTPQELIIIRQEFSR
jgi:hypothetical protein